MDRLTEQLATFATTLNFDRLGDEVAQSVTQHLVDTLACAFAAHDCEAADIGRRLAGGQTAGLYAGRTLFVDATMPLEMASFVNSGMIRKYDFNDRFPGGHPSDGLGAHLALAGAAPFSGKQFLVAMMVTYEIYTRLCDGANLRKLGWDQGFMVAVSTTAGICNLLGLTLEQTANAIGMSATASVPLRVTRSGELTSWKSVATPFAARNGVFAATLAAEGMVGPGNAFEGRHGLFDNITGPFDLAPFPTEGGEFTLDQILFKYWPLETNGQPAVWAAMELRERLTPSDIDNIKSIEFFCDELTRVEIGGEPEKWDPQTRETADHSLPYIFARTLVDGTISIASFEENRVQDSSLRPLLNKITVTVDPAIEALLPDMKLVISVTMHDGTVLEVENTNPPGHPANPMTDEDTANKLRLMGEPLIGAERCNKVIEAWSAVVDVPDLRPLIYMMDF